MFFLFFYQILVFQLLHLTLYIVCLFYLTVDLQETNLLNILQMHFECVCSVIHKMI